MFSRKIFFRAVYILFFFFALVVFADDIAKETSSSREKPWIVFGRYKGIDSTGNGDGIIDAGESIDFPAVVPHVVFDTTTGTLRTVNSYVTNTNSIAETSSIREMSWIVFEYCEIIDSTGDGDEIIDPGESIELPIAVRNVGVNTAYSLTGTLRTTDPYVTMTDSIEEFGDVPPGSVSRCPDAFRFDVADSCPSSRLIDFELVTTDAEEHISTNYFSIFVLSGDIFISVDTLDFETAFIGYSDTLEFQVINLGNGILEVNDISSDNPDYSVDITSFILPPGEERTVQVMLTPISEGISAGSLTVRSGLSDTSIVFLRGECLYPPDISVSPVSFDVSLSVGEISTYSFDLYNTGISDLDFFLSLEGINSMYALNFDGADDYVEVPDNSSLNAIGGAFTLEFWMRVEEYPSNTREVLGKWGPGDASDDEFNVEFLKTGAISSVISGFDGLTEIEGDPILPYTWTHVAEVFDSKSFSYKLFINGVLESSVTPSILAMNRNTSQPFRMGQYGLSYNKFKGQLDEVRIWNVARTQAEIQADMYREPSGAEPGLIGYWKFNESSGYVVYDSSANDNDGTCYGEVARVISQLPVLWLSVDIASGTVSAGNSINIEVTFDATDLYGGDYDADIVISSNDPDEPEVRIPAHLHVVGVPDIAVSEDNLNYGSVFTGYSSTDTLIVYNEGTDSLTVSNISSDNSDFVVDVTNFSLAAGKNQEIIVAFTPSTMGAITGILTIISDDPDESNLEIYLEGECVEPPEMSVPSDSLIDSLLINETSAQWLAIRNTGLGMLAFNTCIKEVSGSFLEEVFGTWRGNVLKDRMNSRGNIYSVNSTTILREIKFYMDVSTSTRMYFVVYEADRMQTNFYKIGEAYIDSSGTGRRWYSSGPMYVELVAGKYYYIGTCWEGFAKYGYSSWIDPEPPLPTSFGRLETGIRSSLKLGFSPRERIYLEEPSGLFRVYYQTIVTGQGILRASPYRDTIPAEDSLETELTFDATNLKGGNYFADITIMSNDPEEQEIIIPARLHVTGIPDIAISEDSFDLGNIFVGFSITDTLIITNEGTDSLMISNISSDNTDFTVDINNFSLCSGSNQEVLVIFTPDATGIRTATLTIESNDPDEQIKTVFLQGEGLSAPVMTVEPEYLSDTLTTGESGSHILTIGNSGGNNLTFEIIDESTEGAGPILALNDNQITSGVKSINQTTDLLNQSVENQSNEKEFQSDKPEGSSPPVTRASYAGDYLQFNISNYGEVIPFQYPVGTEHLQIGDYLSGYTICYSDGGDKVEWAGYMDRSGIVTVSYNEVINDVDSAIIDVVTQTSGGELTITQEFTFDKHDKFVRIETNIENTSGTTLNNVVFKRWADWDMDYDYPDDNWNYDLTHNMIYAWDEHYGTIAAKTPPDYRDIEGWDDYNRRLTDEDYVSGPLTNFDGLEILHYELGNLPSGEGKVLTFTYGTADDLRELKSVVERGIAGVERFTAIPDTGTVLIGDSAEIEVRFDAASLYDGDYYANLLISSNDPITPLDTVLCFLHVIGAPIISTSADTLKFSADSTDTLELKVRNIGTDDLLVTDISSDNSDYSVNITNFVLTPDGSQTVKVIFTPTTVGESNGNLTVRSNDPGKEIYTIRLIGRAPSGIKENIPKVFSISANYPNPFCNETVIKFGCPEKTKVIIEVFDIMGRLIKTLVNKEMDAGYYEVRWDGSNQSGRKVASSVYFYRMQAGNFEATKKMVFAK